MLPKWKHLKKFMVSWCQSVKEVITVKTIPSIETQQRMHAFFMKTSAPRIYKRQLEEAERQKREVELQNENNTTTMAIDVR